MLKRRWVFKNRSNDLLSRAEKGAHGASLQRERARRGNNARQQKMFSILYLALTWLKDNGPMDRPFHHQMCMHITGQGCAIHHIQWAVKRSLGFLNTFTTAWRRKIKPPPIRFKQRRSYFSLLWDSERLISALLGAAFLFSLVKIQRKHWTRFDSNICLLRWL